MIIGTVGALVLIGGFIMILVAYQRNQIRRREEIHRLKMEEQKKVVKASVETQHEERDRIARDLHDEIGGMLSGIKFSLNSIDGTNVGQSVQQVDQNLGECIEKVRTISQDLLPPILAKFGLVAALEDLLERKGEHFEWETRFESSTEVDLESFTEKELYFVIQELLNNLGKYGKASRVTIKLDDNEDVVLSIEDDGIPFDFHKSLENSGHSLGLYSIQARIQAINALLRSERTPAGNRTLLIVNKSEEI